MPSLVFNDAQALHMMGRLNESLAVAEELLTVTLDEPELHRIGADVRRKLTRLA